MIMLSSLSSALRSAIPVTRSHMSRSHVGTNMIRRHRPKSTSSSSTASTSYARTSFIESDSNNDELKSPQSISSPVEEDVAFPTTATGNKMEYQHVPLDANEHAVGYLNRILNARVYEAAIETELQYAKNLSTDLKNTVFLKREDTQPVFSFKIRGAYNKMAHLSPDELNQGVVACSAGNHAQGVALSSRMLGCRAVIVMPLATPVIKVTAVRAHGGPTVEVRLFGKNYDEAAVEAKRLMAEEGMTMIHPFDDPLVIAGQGTIGLEILKSCVSRPLDAIFVCCGGGGMLAGIAAYVKQVRPSVKVIGVEANDAAGMTESLKHGEVTTLDNVGLFADGAAVKTIGDETFRICKKLVDGMVTVDTDQICNAIKMTYNDARVVLEPAGALAVAGMKKYITENEISGQTYVAITSGANLDFHRLRLISERADVSEKILVPPTTTKATKTTRTRTQTHERIAPPSTPLVIQPATTTTTILTMEGGISEVGTLLTAVEERISPRLAKLLVLIFRFLETCTRVEIIPTPVVVVVAAAAAVVVEDDEEEDKDETATALRVSSSRNTPIAITTKQKKPKNTKKHKGTNYHHKKE